ncbi:MAG: tryptophan synthase subunit alpha, partial [Deltaproteobacteria bacterium]
KAIEGGSTVQRCLDFAQRVARDFSIPFLFMSYANILYKYGMEPFSDQMKKINLKGAIVPDLPPEEGKEYTAAMAKNHLAPIYILSPETSNERMAYISTFARGFVYCLARKGVTGKTTSFSTDIADYLKRCRKTTHLPLAVGFGVKDKADVDFLKGKADIAVLGSQTIRVVEKNGPGATGDFIRSLL